MDIEDKADEAAAKLVEELTGGHYSLALAESCTAGLVSDLIARVSGASAVLWGSFVCYSPEAKKRMLRIDGNILEKHGPVSAETAGEMALNALDIEDKADEAAAKLVEELTGGHYSLALAESCTAGLVSDLIARVSGASAVLWGSFVCYSPEAKKRMLRIDGNFLEKHGLVSAETAGEMALNALDIAGVDIAAAVTGLAGPLGDGSAAPVGTVFVGIARRVNGEAVADVKPLFFQGARAEIRMQAALAVIEEVLKTMSNDKI